MRKVLFLMFLLLLTGLGAAGVKAQVRIGGNGAPQGAAVLDLNADNTATPTANKGALALPRVSLASATAQLNGTAPITGMLVYNTNATLGVGIYFYNGSNWVPIDGDGVIGNELTDTIAGGGLTKSGSGTAASPYRVGIKANGITAGMIANAAIPIQKLSDLAADSGRLLAISPDGTILSYATPNAMGIYVDFRTQPAILATPLAVTWTKVYSAVITWHYVPGKITNVNIPGLTALDMCYGAGSGSGVVYTMNGYAYIYQPWGNSYETDAQETLVCYRPSL